MRSIGVSAEHHRRPFVQPSPYMYTHIHYRRQSAVDTYCTYGSPVLIPFRELVTALPLPCLYVASEMIRPPPGSVWHLGLLRLHWLGLQSCPIEYNEISHIKLKEKHPKNSQKTWEANQTEHTQTTRSVSNVLLHGTEPARSVSNAPALMTLSVVPTTTEIVVNQKISPQSQPNTVSPSA